MKTNSELFAICPIDGKYFESSMSLIDDFSEYAIIKYYLKVCCDYFIYICNLDETPCDQFSAEEIADIKNIYLNYDINAAKQIKKLEISHDNVFYAIGNYVKSIIPKNQSMINFGLCDQDIKSLSLAMRLNNYKENFTESIKSIVYQFDNLIEKYSDDVFIPRVGSQPSPPSSISHIFKIYKERINRILSEFHRIQIYCKFGGIVGTLSAHYEALPNADWHGIMNKFTEKYKIPREHNVTSVGSNISLQMLLDNIVNVGNICNDFISDMWNYNMIGYLVKKDYKNISNISNPKFVSLGNLEKAEGNIYMSMSIISSIKSRISRSRMYGDRSGDIIVENLGTPLGHFHIGINSLLSFLKKISFNKKQIDDDINKYQSVIFEAILAIMKREGIVNATEICKNFINSKSDINKGDIDKFIKNLSKYGISKEALEEIRSINVIEFEGVPYVPEMDSIISI